MQILSSIKSSACLELHELVKKKIVYGMKLNTFGREDAKFRM